MTIVDDALHKLHLSHLFHRKLKKKRTGATVVPGAAPNSAAPAPPAGPSIAERSTVIATQLFAPLEGAVLASLDALLDPAYLKGVGLGAEQAAPAINAADRQRAGTEQAELRALLEAATQEAAAAKAREAAAVAELGAVRAVSARELAEVGAKLTAAEAKLSGQAEAAEEARLAMLAAEGKCAAAEGKLELAEQRLAMVADEARVAAAEE